MKIREIVKFLVIRTIGNFLVLFMVFGFFATFGPVLYYEVNYRYEKHQGITYKVVNAATTEEVRHFVLRNKQDKNPEENKKEATGSAQTASKDNQSFIVVPENPNEKILIPKSAEFSIIIPKIGVNEIVSENVNPSNPDEYLEALKKGAAHAKGSAFPGMNGTTYIFAHSTDNFWNVGRYNAIFYLLGKLEVEDEIVIFFFGKRYDYKMAEKKIVEGNDVEYLNSNLGKGERLILQTCWPPGTTWKRLLIFAEPKTIKR